MSFSLLYPYPSPLFIARFCIKGMKRDFFPAYFAGTFPFPTLFLVCGSVSGPFAPPDKGVFKLYPGPRWIFPNVQIRMSPNRKTTVYFTYIKAHGPSSVFLQGLAQQDPSLAPGQLNINPGLYLDLAFTFLILSIKDKTTCSLVGTLNSSQSISSYNLTFLFPSSVWVQEFLPKMRG